MWSWWTRTRKGSRAALSEGMKGAMKPPHLGICWTRWTDLMVRSMAAEGEEEHNEEAGEGEEEELEKAERGSQESEGGSKRRQRKTRGGRRVVIWLQENHQITTQIFRGRSPSSHTHTHTPGKLITQPPRVLENYPPGRRSPPPGHVTCFPAALKYSPRLLYFFFASFSSDPTLSPSPSIFCLPPSPPLAPPSSLPKVIPEKSKMSLEFKRSFVQATSDLVLACNQYPGAPGSTHVLVFSHATGFCKEEWNPVVEELRKLGNHDEILLVDQRNHGDSATINRQALPKGMRSPRLIPLLCGEGETSRFWCLVARCLPA